MGVRRALNLVLEAAEKNHGNLYTFGPLIHNNQVVEMLEGRGVKVIEDPCKADGGRVVLRAHGVTKQEMQAFRDRNIEVIDATCPKVQRSEKFVEQRAAEGKPIIIAGDAGHAEVKALASRTGKEVYVVSTAEEAVKLAPKSTPVLVAQTTFNEQRYEEIAAALRKKYPDITVLDSICSATHERQTEVRELTRRADAIVVVGGKHSANTKRLAEIAQESGRPTFLIETAEELPVAELKQFHTIGVTAGASTPGWVTALVVEKLSRMGEMAWLGWLRLLFVDSGIALSLLAALAAVFNQFIAGQWWRSGIVYVFFFMLSAYNLNRYYTGRKPYHVVRRGSERLWVWATVAGFALTAVAGVLWMPAKFLWLKAIMLVGVAAPFVYTAPIPPWKRGAKQFGDIPYFKDAAVGLAWLIMASLIQWVDAGSLFSTKAALAGGATFLLGVVQSLWGDTQNLDTDRLLGRGTLAASLGRRLVTVALVLGSTAILLMAGAAFYFKMT